MINEVEAWPLRIALVVCCFGFSGCLSVQGPTDLKFVSVKIADLREETDVIFGDPRPSSPELRIDFSSKTDFVKFAHKYEFNIGGIGCLCNSPKDADEELMGPYLFWNDFVVDPYVWDSPQYRRVLVQGEAHQLIIYHVYFALIQSGRPSLYGEKPIFPYDLQHNPSDICFFIRGGNMLGTTFRSNTVVVPKADIVAALQKTGKPTRPGF
jgi:hypothetical protein